VSLRTRLTLGVFLVTLASIGVVYLYVTPTLESRLRDQRIARLRDAADRYGDQLRPTIGTSMPAKAVSSLVTATGQQANFRVTLLNIPRGPLHVGPVPIADSAGGTQDSGLDFSLAERASDERRTVTGWEAGQGGRVAEAARPLFRGQRELTELVRAVEREPRAEVAAGHALGAPLEALDARRERARDDEAADHREQQGERAGDENPVADDAHRVGDVAQRRGESCARGLRRGRATRT